MFRLRSCIGFEEAVCSRIMSVEYLWALRKLHIFAEKISLL